MRSILVVPALLVTAGIAYLLTRSGSEALAEAEAVPTARESSSQAEPAKAAPSAASSQGAPSSPGAEPAPLRDAELEPYRKQLLDLAYATASLVPAMPHVKTRSRCQEEVVVACLELDQARLALQYVEGIDNWRRGAGYADLAYWLAREGRAGEVGPWIERASEFVERMQALEDESVGEVDDESVEGYQAWRKDRIRAKIARTYLVLGDEHGAATFADGLEPSEAGIVEAAWAANAAADDVAEQARVLGSVANEGDFERVKNAVEVGLVLYGRFHGDAECRARLASALRGCLDRAPVMFRMDGRLRMAALAVEHGAAAEALELVREVDGILEQSPLALEDGVPLRARCAALRWQAGEEDAGRALAESTLEKFDAGRASIEDLLRAETLVPLALAFAEMGERGRALEIYRRALLDGSENPNAVPRAEDLSATLVSMARSGVEPDAALWSKAREIHAGLHEPW